MIESDCWSLSSWHGVLRCFVVIKWTGLISTCASPYDIALQAIEDAAYMCKRYVQYFHATQSQNQIVWFFPHFLSLLIFSILLLSFWMLCCFYFDLLSFTISNCFSKSDMFLREWFVHSLIATFSFPPFLLQILANCDYLFLANLLLYHALICYDTLYSEPMETPLR